MLSSFGVDTLNPTVTPRRLWVLSRRLPPGAYPDADHAGSWSVESYLLAAVADTLQDLTWVTVAANSKKGKQPKRPKPIPRPGKAKKRRTAQDGAALSSLRSVMTEVK